MGLDSLLHLCREARLRNEVCGLHLVCCVLSHLWHPLAEDQSTSLGCLCSRDPKSTNKTFDVILTTGCLFFFPPATPDYWQLEQSGFCRAPSLELEKQSVRSPGRSSAPHWEAPNTHRWTRARLIPRFLSPLSSCCIHPPDVNPSLKTETTRSAALAPSLRQLDTAGFSVGSDESESCARWFFHPQLCLSRLARIHCVSSLCCIHQSGFASHLWRAKCEGCYWVGANNQ